MLNLLTYHRNDQEHQVKPATCHVYIPGHPSEPRTCDHHIRWGSQTDRKFQSCCLFLQPKTRVKAKNITQQTSYWYIIPETQWKQSHSFNHSSLIIAISKMHMRGRPATSRYIFINIEQIYSTTRNGQNHPSCRILYKALK